MRSLMLAAMMSVVVLAGCAEGPMQSQSGQTAQPGSHEDAPTGSLIKKRPSANTTGTSDGMKFQTLAKSSVASSRAELG